ncbi:hypothetical protein M9434_000719 [Picochlorum sp. BPE23]|nr:hypothetical protein M9434_000719 [Picochlorum sp. BPE23]
MAEINSYFYFTAVAKSADGVAPAPAEDRFILPKDLPDGIVCEDDSPCTNEKPYCLKPKLKKEGVCVQCRTTLDCVPAQVCNKETYRCERNIFLYTLDSEDWDEDFSSYATIRTGDAVDTAGFITIEVGTSGSTEGSNLTLLAGDVDPANDALGVGGDVVIQSGSSSTGSSGAVDISSDDSLSSGGISMRTGKASNGDSGPIEITTGNATVSAGDILVQVGTSGDGDGGDLILLAGDADIVENRALGDGGDVIIQSGSSADKSSGSVAISSEASPSTGTVSVQTGDASTGDSGPLELTTGDAEESSGSILVVAGEATSGSGGDVTIAGGKTNADDETGGFVTISGGEGPNNEGGSVVIVGGDGVAGGDVTINGGQPDGAVIIGSLTDDITIGNEDAEIAVTGAVTLDGSLTFPSATGGTLFGIYYGSSDATPVLANDTAPIDISIPGTSPGDVASCSVNVADPVQVGFDYIQVSNDEVTVLARNYDDENDVDVIVVCMVHDFTI